MRVIGGQFRSRRLSAPHGLATRPTSDRLRETLFNVLGPRVAGANFADVYAGSGAVGIEAISRGAAFCTFVERSPAALAALRANLSSLQINAGVRIDGRAVARVLDDLASTTAPGQQPLSKDKQPFDLVFLDPPYEAASEYTATLTTLGVKSSVLLAPEAIVIAEHSRKTSLPESFHALQRYRLLEQGDAALSFYSVAM